MACVQLPCLFQSRLLLLLLWADADVSEQGALVCLHTWDLQVHLSEWKQC